MDDQTWTLRRLVFWICGVCIALGSASFPAPSRIHCELLEHSNITCFWTPVSSESTSYMLSVNMTCCSNGTNYKPVGSCITTQTQCSVSIGSVSHFFCVDVLASSPSGAIRSAQRCFAGINEVKMYPPRITRLVTIPGKGHCLKLEWSENTSVYLQSEKDHGVLQIEYRTLHQARLWTVSTALHDWQMELCGLYPGTKHYVRIRAQDRRAPQHWSSWSAAREATTTEAAPSAAPELWRHVQPVDGKGQRLITLLWKPLQWPDSNGEILHYAVFCWSDLDRSHWDCGQLNPFNLSCVLFVPAHPCTCNLTASNSAGTSPSALIHIPRDGDTVIPPPVLISVIPLDDYQLKVDWTVAVEQSETNFVVEWFPIPDNTANGLYWKILNGSSRSLIITEGVKPEVPYNVSIQAFNKKKVGAAVFAIAFTRQGAPSVGPTLEVLQTTSSHVTLRWKAVPLEKLCGFIQNYTILYKTNGKVKSLVLGGDVEQVSLNGLSAGDYTICVMAHTVAGCTAGPWVTVAVGNDYMQLTAILLSAVGTLLILMILLSQVERIQQSLCPTVPDPSKSSLSTWPPVSGNQYKLNVLDFKQSSSLVELICEGGKAGHRDHYHHQDHSPVSAFSYQSVPSKSVSQESKYHAVSHRPLLSNTDRPEAEQTLNELNAEEFVKDLTTGHKSKVMPKPQSSRQIQVPSSLLSLSESYLAVDVLNPPLCRKCMSRLDSQIHALSKSPSVPDFLSEVVAVDLTYKRNFKSRLEPFCYNNLSTGYLPVPESYGHFGVEAEDSANLIKRSHLFSDLQSCCYTHLSTTYLPVPESSVAYADLVMKTVDTSEHLRQSRLTSTIKSHYYTHVSSSYAPVPVTHAAFGEKALESSRSQQLCQSSPRCTDFKMVETYRPLEPDETPFLPAEHCGLNRSATGMNVNVNSSQTDSR